MRVKALAIAFLAIILVGCESVSEEKADGSKIDETSDSYIVENYTDPETGVCYLIYEEIHPYGSSGGITVRYNGDGSIMVKGDLK